MFSHCSDLKAIINPSCMEVVEPGDMFLIGMDRRSIGNSLQ